MAGLSALTGVPVEPVEAVGWDGDAIEAQAFGFLAVRSLRGLPLSVPSTTGVPVPTTGGQLHHAA
jgi:anhydro-N-acetylmuramic acid kinase